MENVAHSLFGVVIGEAIFRARKPGPGRDPAAMLRERAGLLWAAVLGSNLPDFDFLLKPIVDGGHLGSVLHHRGFTHQVVASVPLAVIGAGVGALAIRVRDWGAERKLRRSAPGGVIAAPLKRPRAPWAWLLLAAWIGVLGHLGADWWNDYGVHPFWPFSNQWYYGDFIFIVEPLFWLCLLPFVFRISHGVWGRIACLCLGGAMLVAAWSGRFMSWPVALWLTVWAGAWSAWFARPRGVGWAIGGIGAVLLLFGVPSRIVRERISARIPPGERLLNLSTMPAPGNPLCWRVLLTTRTAELTGNPPADYLARGGVFVFQPFGLGESHRFGPNDPATCQLRELFGKNDALFAPVEAPTLQWPQLRWAGEFRGQAAALEAARATHCRAEALLRFVRMPFWTIAPSGDMLLGDLRYHGGKGLGFADGESYVGEPCYKFEPPWTPPSGI